MNTMTKPEVIERFHLALLQVLPQHLSPANYAVKGGANLRLFFESPRRSEDIDLNFVGRANWSLQTRMDAVLKAPALLALLANQGIKIGSVNPSKTTDTTGRWKFQLEASGVQVNSKIEFSMRGEDRPLYRSDSVSPRLAAAVGMRPAMSNHYLPAAAIEQKISALAQRSETQARDVFDLDFLVTRFSADARTIERRARELDLAKSRLFEVGYADYLDLVIPFLDPAFVEMYRPESEWDRQVLTVSAYLEDARRHTP